MKKKAFNNAYDWQREIINRDLHGNGPNGYSSNNTVTAVSMH